MLINAAKYKWLTSCTGVELRIRPGNLFDCRYCGVAIDGDQLTIESKGEVSGSLADVVKMVPKDKPIAIVLSGKGILIKKGSSSETGQSLSALFPAINEDEFYVQAFSSAETSYFAVIRQEVADEIINGLFNASPEILAVSLGPFTVSHIYQQLNHYGNEFVFDGHVVTLDDGEWKDYRYEEGSTSKFPVKVDIEPIDEKFILAYSAAFQLVLLERLPIIQIAERNTLKAQGEFKEKKKFHYRTVMILAILFCLLLINFSLLSFYSSRNRELSSMTDKNNSELSNAESMLRQFKQNERLLKEIGWRKGTGVHNAYILDEIGRSLPNGISLNSLQVNAGEESDPERGRILVVGNVMEAQTVSGWIQMLREKDWILEVKLEFFEPAGEKGIHRFKLVIGY